MYNNDIINSSLSLHSVDVSCMYKGVLKLESSFYLRKIDELGRVVLPIDIRNALSIKEKDTLEISVKNNGIFLQKKEDTCVFCNLNKNLTKLNEKNICKNCINKLKEEI